MGKASELEKEFPEHAKMNKYIDENWAIRDFLHYLQDQGIFLARYSPLRHQIEALMDYEMKLLAWRGVDPQAYGAEAEVLNKRYKIDKLVEKVVPPLPQAPKPPPLPEVVKPPLPQVSSSKERDQSALDHLLKKIRREG